MSRARRRRQNRPSRQRHQHERRSDHRSSDERHCWKESSARKSSCWFDRRPGEVCFHIRKRPEVVRISWGLAMQTPANQDDLPRAWRDVLSAGSWYRLGIIHLGSEFRDPGVSPDEFPPQLARSRLAGAPNPHGRHNLRSPFPPRSCSRPTATGLFRSFLDEQGTTLRRHSVHRLQAV